MSGLDLRTAAVRKLEKLSEMKELEEALSEQRKELERRTESLRRAKHRKDDKEEQLKLSLLKFNKFLTENDLKCSRALKKTFEERELTRQKKAEVEYLEQESMNLQRKRQQLQFKVQRRAVYKDFLDEVTKRSKKFGEIRQLTSRFDTLLANREQLLLKGYRAQELAEAQRWQHRCLIEEQGNRILQYNNQLSSLQTQLDQVSSRAFKWETTWNHVQSTAAKETLMLGQIKMATLNLFHMMRGGRCEKPVKHISPTEEQLTRIQLFIQDQTCILHDLQNNDLLLRQTSRKDEAM